MQSGQGPLAIPWTYPPKPLTGSALPLGHGGLTVTLIERDQKSGKGVAVNHWKSSTGVKLTDLVLATP